MEPHTVRIFLTLEFIEFCCLKTKLYNITVAVFSDQYHMCMFVGFFYLHCLTLCFFTDVFLYRCCVFIPTLCFYTIKLLYLVHVMINSHRELLTKTDRTKPWQVKTKGVKLYKQDFHLMNKSLGLCSTKAVTQ